MNAAVAHASRRRWTALVALVVAGLLALAATAARPRAGSWSGPTAQNKPISFRVGSSGRVKDLRLAFRARCDGGGTTGGTTTFAGPFRVRDGRFRIEAGSTWVRGRFPTRRRATGTFRWRGSLYTPSGPSRTCDSGEVRWSARRR